MKKIVFIVILLSFKMYSQNFSGTWNVISYEDEITYYNKIKDSISYKDLSRQNEANNFRKKSDLLIFPITYKFDNNNNFSMNHSIMGEIGKGKFELDKLNKKIVLLDKDGKKDEILYNYENGILFIEIELENSTIKIGLIKSTS